MLKWNVYFSDVNTGRIVVKNIFQLSTTFLESCANNYKYNKDSRENFIEQLRRDLYYTYWGRCEYEITIDHWPQTENEKFKTLKTDVASQVELNWNVFCDYVWENREQLKKKKPKKS